MSESIDLQLMTLAKASPGNGVKSGKTGTSANGRGFAEVLDQHRSSPADAARNERSGTAAGGKAVPVGRQGDAAEAAADADKPVDDRRATPSGDEIAADGAAARDVNDPPVGSPATAAPVDSAAQVDSVARPALSDSLLTPGADGRMAASEADASAAARNASRLAAGAVSAEAPVNGSASATSADRPGIAPPAPADGFAVAPAPSETRVAAAQIDGSRPVADVVTGSGTNTAMRRAQGDASDLPRPAPGSAAGASAAGDAGLRAAATPGPNAAPPAAVPLAQSAEAGPPDAGDILSAGPAQRSDSSAFQAPSAPAGMTPATAAAPSQAAGSSAAEGDTPVLQMDTAPEDAEFPREMSSRVSLMLRDGSREARLQLHPAELGRVQVTINTDGDQARVLFVAESAAAREAIEQAMPRLREALAQQGMELAQADVGQQGPHGDRSGGQDDPARTAMSSTEGPSTEAATADQPAVTLHATSRLDLYA